MVPLAGDNPAAASRALELVIAGSEWHLLDYARDPIRAVLEGLLAGDDEQATQTARRLINSLGEKGVHGMQDLLNAA